MKANTTKSTDYLSKLKNETQTAKPTTVRKPKKIKK
jgi:hypothetical protein